MENKSVNMSFMRHLQQISVLIQQKSAKNVVMQVPKKKLNQIFSLTQELRKRFPNSHFYTLFDSLKNQCCVDILGGRHVDYDLLIHFGYACFSQPYSDKHFYIFQQADPQIEEIVAQNLRKSIKEARQKITLFISQQNIYNKMRKIFQSEKLHQQDLYLCSFNFDHHSQRDQYFGFGYYAPKEILAKQINLCILSVQQQTELLSNVYLSQKPLKITKIYTITADNILQQSNHNINKKLMQRMFLSSELQKYEIFGICVSNPSTQFCSTMIARTQRLLKNHHKKYFLFMMNNLTEMKLGNFPEIEVYIIVSCFNHSLYSSKDFHRLVITPFDLQLAFGDKKIDEYLFDWKSITTRNLDQQQMKFKKCSKQVCEKQQCKCKTQKTQQLQLQKTQQELMLASSIQTLDYYRQKQYKGLDFSQKKPIQKIRLGKIGLAEQYQPLSENTDSSK